MLFNSLIYHSTDPLFEAELQEDIESECLKLGELEKVTVFQKHEVSKAVTASTY